ncbi:hypothetical protein BD626DRAFT_539985 [Schizophyllum amplum]|uniref:Uncharacterized protein n=1 Tax=Schizophyllum amplum TaxID=97359 RepID=A0A550C171_9AGAR|nr:hypothetical protein BD626DRAFT_539985 [Auriculariopsis ampla]
MAPPVELRRDGEQHGGRTKTRWRDGATARREGGRDGEGKGKVGGVFILLALPAAPRLLGRDECGTARVHASQGIARVCAKGSRVGAEESGVRAFVLAALTLFLQLSTSRKRGRARAKEGSRPVREGGQSSRSSCLVA